MTTALILLGIFVVSGVANYAIQSHYGRLMREEQQRHMDEMRAIYRGERP